jgi:hypothetical protein
MSSNGYSTQSTHYLRISKYSVLQMTLYLDPLHVDWMNDSIMERVLFALRDRIPVKLKKETDEGRTAVGKKKKKSSVDVYRGGASSFLPDRSPSDG